MRERPKGAKADAKSPAFADCQRKRQSKWTGDDIIIIDAEREYGPLARALGGEVIEIFPRSRRHINPLEELDTLDELLTDLSVSQEAVAALLRSLPDDLSPERRAVVETACKLVGKVNYFLGAITEYLAGPPDGGRCKRSGPRAVPPPAPTAPMGWTAAGL